jgi:sec-independent protein translocase protein TatB
MFGMGFSEIVVILVIALIFLGPEKLPQAAKSISKGIRDLRKQTRELQTTIESDEALGGAIRDLRSAMRGEEPRPLPPRPPPGVPVPGDKPNSILPPAAKPPETSTSTSTSTPPEPAAAKPADEKPVRLPDVVGETEAANDDKGLEQLVRPADGTVAKGS